MRHNEIKIGNNLWVHKEIHRDIPDEMSIVISSGNTRSGAWLSKDEAYRLTHWLTQNLQGRHYEETSRYMG